MAKNRRDDFFKKAETILDRPIDDEARQYRCETCHDLGVVRADVPLGHPLFGRLHPCPNPDCPVVAENRRRAHQQTSRAGVPPAYRGYTIFHWANSLTKHELTGKALAWGAGMAFVKGDGHYFTVTEAAALVRRDDWSDPDDEPRNWLAYYGELGTGKTSLVTGIVNSLDERNQPALYIRLQDLLAEIQSRYGTDEPPSPEQVLKRFQDAPILAVDEFNVSNVTADRMEKIESLIRHRHAYRLPTIITTNLRPDEFGDEWGWRITDVMGERAHWIRLSGPRLRHTPAPIE